MSLSDHMEISGWALMICLFGAGVIGMVAGYLIRDEKEDDR